MPTAPPTAGGARRKTQPPRARTEYEANRPSAAKRGYDERWRKARKQYLHGNPLCVACKREGKATPANVVDHVVPHRGDSALFWDVTNWQALCKPCHDRKTARGE